jgi:phosphopantothenoylcysteine decarboxylase/phosphopantothenate--cysteine ligase
MKILLGVSGGVAAYKAAELTRELQRRGAEVQVVMTAGAERFVTPLTFAALSGQTVLTSMWETMGTQAAGDDLRNFEIEHIRIAQEIDAFVIAPATANVIAKLANGIADDLLSTIYLAAQAPVLVAPAMNVNMWKHAAAQQNIVTLRSRGVQIVEPAAGYLACGMTGEGRLAEPSEIADAVFGAIATSTQRTKDFAGETILITAGGTREPIDPVRYIGNRSSGKMGHALAAAALDRGAQVILVTCASGAEPLPCDKIHVTSAPEMHQAVMAKLAGVSTVIMAAAVSDFRVKQPSIQKIKKQELVTLELVQNEDILAQVARRRYPGTLVIGFAAETERVLEEGRRKLRAKGIDAVVVNDVSQPESGFEVDRNAGIFLTPDKEIALPMSSKREMADRILDQISSLRNSVRTGASVLVESGS